MDSLIRSVLYPKNEQVMDAKDETVIRVRVSRGQGDEQDPTHDVIQYYRKDGAFIGEFDPVKERRKSP